MSYDEIPDFCGCDVDEVLSQGNLETLRILALSFATHSESPEQAEAVCLRLAGHEDGVVRGNAVLGLGHVARIHRALTERLARPAIQAALRDHDWWVRQQAGSAASDVELFLKWKLDRP